MAGANMFVVYTNADGGNVTLSPRIGRGHRMPKNEGVGGGGQKVRLLEGSGVKDGMMVANVLCECPVSFDIGLLWRGVFEKRGERMMKEEGWDGCATQTFQKKYPGRLVSFADPGFFSCRRKLRLLGRRLDGFQR